MEDFIEYAPVVGRTQVQEMTRSILNLKSIPKPDDAADALAIAMCHAHTAGSQLHRHMV